MLRFVYQNENNFTILIHSTNLIKLKLLSGKVAPIFFLIILPVSIVIFLNIVEIYSPDMADPYTTLFILFYASVDFHSVRALSLYFFFKDILRKEDIVM